MKNPVQDGAPTRAEKLLAALADGDWHSTKELVRRVGHTFAGAKFTLTEYGYNIERRPHPTLGRQSQYRLRNLPRED